MTKGNIKLLSKFVTKTMMLMTSVLAYSRLGESPVYAIAVPCSISKLCCFMLVRSQSLSLIICFTKLS